MSGLGLEPRWLLNRFRSDLFSFVQTTWSWQVLRKAEDKESAVETVKAKEESLPVAEESCWKGLLLSILQGTGDILIPFPCKVKIVTGEYMESAANVTFLLQRLLRSLSSPLLSWGSTQASPFTFTKEMIDFFFDQKSDIALFTYLDFDI